MTENKLTQAIRDETELAQKIRTAANAYYTGNDSMSDSFFDGLTKKLRDINPNHPLLTTTAWGYVAEAGEEFPHAHPMGSLDKRQLEDLTPDDEVDGELSSKLDGLACSLLYIDGKFDKGLTRNTGEVGKKINIDFKAAGVPMEVDKGLVEVRGEIVMSDAMFDSIREEAGYTKARAAVSGIVTSTDSVYKDRVVFVAYSLKEHRDNPELPLEYLHDVGFHTVISKTVRLTKSVAELIYGDKCNVFMNTMELATFPNDGLVFVTDMEQIGDAFFPDAFAIKFPTEEVEATVDYIDWIESDKGRCVPTIVIKPVELDGSTVTRCAGYNAAFIRDEGLGPGAVIKITLANQIIPDHRGTLTKVTPQMPDDAEYHWDGVHLRRPVRHAELAWKTLLLDCCPKGVGRTTVDKLWGAYFEPTATLAQVLKSLCVSGTGDDVVEALAEVVGDAMALKVIEGFKTFGERKYTIGELMEYSHLDGWGESAGKCLDLFYGENFASFADDIPVLSESAQLKEVMPTGTPQHSLIDGWMIARTLICVLAHKLKAAEPEKAAGAIPITLTGKLSMSRGALVESWAKYGVEEVGIGKAKYLVCDVPSNSSKFQKAEKAGVVIITEVEFVKVLEAL